MGFLNEDKCNRESQKMSASKTDCEADLWCPGIKTLFSEFPKELVKYQLNAFSRIHVLRSEIIEIEGNNCQQAIRSTEITERTVEFVYLELFKNTSQKHL